MDRFLPDVSDEQLDGLYVELALADAPPGRPYVALGMVTSVDGAAEVGGTSGSLGGPADGVAYRRLRDHVDGVLVGAGTVRAERYRPPRADPGRMERRRARGQTPLPTIVVVTASADLEAAPALFEDPERRPIVATVEAAPAGRVEALRRVADVVVAGEQQVDLVELLGSLRGRGWESVLCEGGPSLNAALVRQGLADELFVTLAPRLVGETRMRIVDGPLGRDVDLELRELRHHESELLLRYGIG